MNVALLAARLVLCAVFVVAGAAKLADRDGSRRALVDFGVPKWAATFGGVLLPWAELMVGLSLLPTMSAWYGAIAALGLLLAFVVGIGANLAFGRTPDCHCFGQLHSAPAGWSTLARNAVLAAAAGLVVWSGPADTGPSAIAWVGDLTLVQRLIAAGAVATLALLAGQSVLLLQILRQQGRVILRLEALETGAPAPSVTPEPAPQGLPVGTPAPTFALESLKRRRVALSDLLARGNPALLFFTSPACGPCTGLLPEIAHWQREHAGAFNLALVAEGSTPDNAAKAEQFGLDLMLVQDKREVAELYLAYGTPAAVIVDRDGKIGSPLAYGAEAIRLLVARTLGRSPPASRPAPAPAAAPARAANGNGATPPRPVVGIGQQAPLIKLPDLDGKQISLRGIRGEQTLLLFWSNRCGYCRSMLDDLRAWEASQPPGAPNLIVISSGDVAENRALNLRSRVLLDNDHQAAPRFGANGTPMAVLLDEKGRVASGVAAGAPAVLALAYGTSGAKDGSEAVKEAVNLQ